MSKRTWVLGLVVALGVLGVEACSDSDTASNPPASAGNAGTTAGAGGHSGSAGHAGTAPVAGATSDAGQAGEGTGDAGAAGSEAGGGAGTAGTTNGGSAGTATGGTAGATGGTAGTAGATGGTAGTAGATGGTAGTAGATGGTAGASGAATTFTLQTKTLGQVISTSTGFSLYVLKTDTAATSTAPPVTTCTAACLNTWPIYYGNPVSVSAGLLASDFGSYDRGSGVMQSTYKGWPLYTYVPDLAVGDMKGEGVGNKWYSARLPFPAFTLQTTTLGQVIATAGGLSLYVLKTDTVGTSTTAPVSTCTGGCLSVWPVYYGAPLNVPTGLLASDFGTFDRGGGVLQSTYKGWPLYRYTPDTVIGDVLGEASGLVWYTAKSPFVAPP